jgi:hypothetical protein
MGPLRACLRTHQVPWCEHWIFARRQRAWWRVEQVWRGIWLPFADANNYGYAPRNRLNCLQGIKKYAKPGAHQKYF